MTDARTWLDLLDARINAAKAGPWYRQDGNALPGPRWTGQPEWFIDSDATLIAYSPIDEPDAEFIAHARTDLPAMSAALRAVLDLHARQPFDYNRMSFGQTVFPDECGTCHVTYPCVTVNALTTALEDA